jgi:membrane protein DedA with SNARE-associated domain
VLVAGITSSITSFIGNHGVYAVFLLMAIDAVFPAASELVMLYAGALAAGAFPGQHVVLFGATISSHAGGFVVMALSGTLGYLAGALVGWAVGLYGGRPLLERRGRFLHFDEESLARADRWFERWHDWAVLIGRITPLVRSFISIPAGVLRMRLWAYVVLTAVGSAIWAFAFAAAGWGLGTSYRNVHHDFRYVDIAIVVIVVLVVALWLVRKIRSTRLKGRGADPAG